MNSPQLGDFLAILVTVLTLSWGVVALLHFALVIGPCETGCDRSAGETALKIFGLLIAAAGNVALVSAIGPVRRRPAPAWQAFWGRIVVAVALFATWLWVLAAYAP